MSAFHKDETGLYSKAEAFICLNCSETRCRGNCDRLRRERKRIARENKPEKPKKRKPAESPPSQLYITEEFDIPDEPPWPKKNPYTKETHTNDEGTAAKLPQN